MARFEPSDAVLISSYLSPKIRNEVLAWDVIGFSDEVYDKPPCDFCTDSTAVLDGEKHYFFTLLKMGENRVLRSVGSYGTWCVVSTKKIYDSGSGKTIIGFKKLLNFKVKGEGKEMKTTDWLMHEFSVTEKGSDLVLCVIYKKNKKEVRGLALALERSPSVVDSGILGSPKSVSDQNSHSLSKLTPPEAMSFLRWRLPLPLPLPLGVRFEPSDAVLISSYLSPKIREEVLAWDVIGFSDEVYDKPPWDFCTDLTAVLDDEKHYFFTLLKRGKNHVLRSVGSYGTWCEISTKKICDSGSGKTIIGFNKLLNFRVKGEGKEMNTTDWLMHEFSVAEKGSDLVLCVIYKKNKEEERACTGEQNSCQLQVQALE